MKYSQRTLDTSMFHSCYIFFAFVFVDFISAEVLIREDAFGDFHV
jgi:hypothetical protein